jgi:hypothetical protein
MHCWVGGIEIRARSVKWAGMHTYIYVETLERIAYIYMCGWRTHAQRS